MGTRNVVSCPDCGQSIDLGSRRKVGQRLTCPNCHAYLEIINLEPPEADWVFSDSGLDWESHEVPWD